MKRVFVTRRRKEKVFDLLVGKPFRTSFQSSILEGWRERKVARRRDWRLVAEA